MSNIEIKDANEASQFIMALGTGALSNPFVLGRMSLAEMCAMGLIPNSWVEHKFGSADDLDIGDGAAWIWDGLSDAVDDDLGDKIPIPTYSTLADISQLSSSSAADVGNIIEVSGLDTNLDVSEQNIVLDGQNGVPLPVALKRVNRMSNISPTGGAVAGNVYLTTAGTTLTDGLPLGQLDNVRAILRAELDQTQMSMYTVPRNKTALVSQGWSTLNRAGTASVDINIIIRTIGLAFRRLHTTSLSNTGSSESERPYATPIPIPEMTDIAFVGSASDNGSGVSAGFHAMILDNDWIAGL